MIFLDTGDSFWSKIIYITSFIIIGAVAFLILGPRPANIQGSLDVSSLPKLNVFLNSVTTLLLIGGYYFIRKKERVIHKRLMLSAFGTSTGFLVSYVIYHWFKSGPKIYVGDLTVIYYFILISHILLAAIITPLALFTLYHGWNNSLQKHRKIAKITLPIWLYVSVTGIIIYGMLYL
jgi:putative membrane protein|tara:strand:- start:877 stop:1407 length:531 start_codon:yes stop_codon:yes gene_type:complete